jgi:integrase
MYHLPGLQSENGIRGIGRGRRGLYHSSGILGFYIVLRRILKRAKLWHVISDDVRPLKEPPTIGRALSPDQKSALLEAAALKPEWETAYFAAVLALNTTMRGCELRGLRWSDIDLLNDTLTIPKSKTDAGVRVIPLTRDAFDVLVKLRERAELFGSVESDHYVFSSFKPVGRFDGNKLVESLESASSILRGPWEAGKKHGRS